MMTQTASLNSHRAEWIKASSKLRSSHSTCGIFALNSSDECISADWTCKQRLG